MRKLSRVLRGGKRFVRTLRNRIKKHEIKRYLYTLVMVGGVLLVSTGSNTQLESTKSSLNLVKLDTNSPLVLKGQEMVSLSFVKGPSNQQIRKLASLQRGRSVVVRERAPEPGPSLEEKRAVYREVAGQYGIDPKVLESVHQVETGKSWGTNRKSYAGATGPMQFMPGTWRKYQTDGNGDGQASIHDPVDALHGAAKLLAANGAASGDVRRALYSYNHSQAYVNKVLRIADSIK